MIRFALDTNIVVALLKTRASPLAERIRSRSVEEIAVSSIVMFELYFGAFNSARRAENVSKLAAARFQVLPFEQEDAKHAAKSGLCSGRGVLPLALLTCSLPDRRERAA